MSVRARTAVVPSAQVVRFVIGEGESSAEAVVEFSAGARVVPGTTVILTIEAAPPAHDGAGGPDPDAVLTYRGEGDDTISGALAAGSAATAARWDGGGLRKGRLILTLRHVGPGTYTIPIRLAVNVP